MPVTYMAMWSAVVLTLFGFWRLRDWSQVLVMTGVTAVILLFSQALFVELSWMVGVNPFGTISLPGDYLYGGVYGWLALLIMPCGWLGPVVGLYLAQKLAVINDFV
jgi:hypothetical protein